TVSLWSLKTMQCVWGPLSFPVEVDHVLFSPDGGMIAVSTVDGVTRVHRTVYAVDFARDSKKPDSGEQKRWSQIFSEDPPATRSSPPQTPLATSGDGRLSVVNQAINGKRGVGIIDNS